MMYKQTQFPFMDAVNRQCYNKHSLEHAIETHKQFLEYTGRTDVDFPRFFLAFYTWNYPGNIWYKAPKHAEQWREIFFNDEEYIYTPYEYQRCIKGNE